MVHIGRVKQFHAAFASNLGCLGLGMMTVWPSYTSELYSSNTTTLLSKPMTKMEGSLLGSLPSLSAIIGTAIACFFLDKFGRKNGGIILSIPYVFAWAIIGVTSSIKLILVARLLAGIAAGGTSVLGPVLVSEIAEDSIRGALASNSTVLNAIGVLVSYLLGWFCGYKTIIWVNVTISVVNIGLLMLVDETPAHLIRIGREEEAKLSVARYRGVSVCSKTVIDEIIRLKKHIITHETKLKTVLDYPAIEEDEKEKLNYAEIQPKNNKLMSSFKALFFSWSSRRAFLVVTTVVTLQVFMGMILVQVYASTVFNEADPSRSNLYTVLFAAIQLFACLIVTVAADKVGRRFLQITSSSLVAICLAGLGYLLQYKVAPPWVTVLVIMIYCVVFVVGAGSVPYILLPEVFTPEVISLASTLIMEWVWFLNFVVILIFPYIIEFLDIYGAFYGFAAIALFNAIISYFILPETAGLCNEDIQKVFSPRRKNNYIESKNSC